MILNKINNKLIKFKINKNFQIFKLKINKQNNMNNKNKILIKKLIKIKFKFNSYNKI